MDLAGCGVDERLDPRRLIPPFRGAHDRRTIAFTELDQPRSLAVDYLAAGAPGREPIPIARLQQVERKRRDVDRTRQQVVTKVEPRILLRDASGLTRRAAFEQAAQPLLTVADREAVDFKRIPVTDPPFATAGPGQRVIRAQRPGLIVT